MALGQVAGSEVEATNSQAMMTSRQERRWACRRSVTTPGVVHVPGNYATIACTLRDQSSTGAQLEAHSDNARSEFVSKNYGPEFWLYMPCDRAQVKCEVVWFSGRKFGVRYTSQIRFIQRPESAAKRRRR